MPELPEVEAVCRKLRADAVGSTIVNARMLRRRNRRLEDRLRSREITAVKRRGKNLLLHLSGELVLRVHLRMSGNLYVLAAGQARPATTRAYFELNDARTLVFDNPRALGIIELLTPAEWEAAAASLGMEPLSEEFTVEWLAAAAARSRQPAKCFLLNQSHLAGLGNIYSAEALHRARIHPAKPMNRLRRPKLEALHAAVVRVLRDAVKSACNAYAGAGRYNSLEIFPVAVYGREGRPCPVCGRLVRRILQAGRATYYCPGCQR